MLQQTPIQKANLSQEIERLLKNELNLTVNYYMSKYRQVFQSRLGMNDDDILNDVRIQIWKGLISWRSDKKTGQKTYINNLLKNRFATLYQQTTMDKYNKIDYYSDSMLASGAIKDTLVSHETGESILLKREAYLLDNEDLILDTHKSIYEDLRFGLSLNEMCESRNLTKIEVVRIIREICDKLKC